MLSRVANRNLEEAAALQTNVAYLGGVIQEILLRWPPWGTDLGRNACSFHMRSFVSLVIRKNEHDYMVSAIAP